MAVDSRNKRASIVNGLVSMTLAPVTPDGTLGASDRLHSAQLYAGIAAAFHEFFSATAGSYTITGVSATLRDNPPSNIRITNARFGDLGVRISNPRFQT